MRPGAKDRRLVHKLVRDTAKEMAGAFYDFAAHDNVFYKHYPSCKFFIDYEWQKFVYAAKQALTTMLTTPGRPDAERTQIYDALIADSTLPYSHQETQIVNFPH